MAGSSAANSGAGCMMDSTGRMACTQDGNSAGPIGPCSAAAAGGVRSPEAGGRGIASESQSGVCIEATTASTSILAALAALAGGPSPGPKSQPRNSVSLSGSPDVGPEVTPAASRAGRAALRPRSASAVSPPLIESSASQSGMTAGGCTGNPRSSAGASAPVVLCSGSGAWMEAPPGVDASKRRSHS